MKKIFTLIATALTICRGLNPQRVRDRSLRRLGLRQLSAPYSQP